MFQCYYYASNTSVVRKLLLISLQPFGAGLIGGELWSAICFRDQKLFSFQNERKKIFSDWILISTKVQHLQMHPSSDEQNLHSNLFLKFVTFQVPRSFGTGIHFLHECNLKYFHIFKQVGNLKLWIAIYQVCQICSFTLKSTSHRYLSSIYKNNLSHKFRHNLQSIYCQYKFKDTTGSYAKQTQNKFSHEYKNYWMVQCLT